MPTPRRTQPGASRASLRAVPKEDEDILSMGVPIEDMEEEPVHLLLYGRNRIGKTTLACEFPKPLALISLEAVKSGGARSVKNVTGITHFMLRASEKVERIGHQLRYEKHHFQSVVIDSGTALDEIILAEICGWEQTAEMLRWGKVSQDQYTERSERMRKVLRDFLELPIHLVIVCNEKDHNPPEGKRNALVRGVQTESFFAAAMGGGTTRWVQDGCEVCQLYMEKEVVKRKRTVGQGRLAKEVVIEEETGRNVRRLRTAYHPNFSAGFRGEYRDDVPEFVEGANPTEMYENFMKAMRGEKIE